MSAEPAESHVADATDPDAPPPVKPYAAVLHEHRGGGLHNEAGEDLARVVAAVIEHQKKGSVTIKLTVTPDDADPRQVIVTDELTVKVPKATPQPSRFFSDDHGNLSRRDPRQPEISGLRDASANQS